MGQTCEFIDLQLQIRVCTKTVINPANRSSLNEPTRVPLVQFYRKKVTECSSRILHNNLPGGFHFLRSKLVRSLSPGPKGPVQRDVDPGVLFTGLRQVFLSR